MQYYSRAKTLHWFCCTAIFWVCSVQCVHANIPRSVFQTVFVEYACGLFINAVFLCLEYVIVIFLGTFSVFTLHNY